MSSDTPHIRYITADGSIIASVRHRLEQSQEEALANAAVMKAAPEMLAAIRAILFQFTQGDKVFERDACIAMAREAYAKAMK